MSGNRDWYRWEGNDLILRVRVQPRASADLIVGPAGDSLRVRLTAPPLEGRANARLIKLMAKVFRVAESQISLLSGQGARDKRLHIQSPRSLPPYISRPSLPR
jgi:uncharacterized protein